MSVILDIIIIGQTPETVKSKPNMATTTTTETESALLKLTLAYDEEIHDQVSPDLDS